jgi:hypothetical protein
VESRTFSEKPHLKRVELQNNRIERMLPSAIAVTVYSKGKEEEKGGTFEFAALGFESIFIFI